MREAYTLFKDGGDPEKVVLAEVPMCICNLYSHSLFLSIFLYFLLSFFFGFSQQQTFRVALMVRSFILHYMLEFTMNLRYGITNKAQFQNAKTSLSFLQELIFLRIGFFHFQEPVNKITKRFYFFQTDSVASPYVPDELIYYSFYLKAVLMN